MLGSIAPDLGYFLLGGTASRDWHRPHGVLLYCLPVAFVIYLLVTRYLAAPVARHLPRGGAFRLGELAYLEAQPRTLRHFVMVAACIVAGAGTHLAWDLFTHDGSWMGDYIPWLAADVLTVRGHAVHGSNLLWVASTVLGGLFTLVVLREIGLRSLVRRWAEARLPGSTTRIDPDAEPAYSHAAFWMPVAIVTVVATAVAYVTRPAGFYWYEKATWVLVFLRGSAPGFLTLALSAWRERRAWRHRTGGVGRDGGARVVDPAA